ncbi:beta-class carbonic anhydrase [Halalkalibacter krulwichiae]|uniref:carbonic anhydrase n=1 Tax=Halalkalibacter krulwichiae TaxID=199441 RepID=A0A1X9MEB5_9BACI|nr:carbonic anhydrase [Halalkalibacter krulwichiae]ARK31787.1 Beta-carbonic anhydrase 1 [Halalkalibacter krulwichiae]
MTLLDKILSHNEKFVANKEFERYKTTKFPNKKVVILSCMDTRLSDLLPVAMNVKHGDAKIIKNAGAVISHPFGSIMRSILLAVYELNADEVMVVGHHNCGMSSLEPDHILTKAVERGIDRKTIETLQYSGVDMDSFLTGFTVVEDSVRHSVELIANHPLIPKDVSIHGLVICPETGALELIINGYAKKSTT